MKIEKNPTRPSFKTTNILSTHRFIWPIVCFKDFFICFWRSICDHHNGLVALFLSFFFLREKIKKIVTTTATKMISEHRSLSNWTLLLKRLSPEKCDSLIYKPNLLQGIDIHFWIPRESQGYTSLDYAPISKI